MFCPKFETITYKHRDFVSRKREGERERRERREREGERVKYSCLPLFFLFLFKFFFKYLSLRTDHGSQRGRLCYAIVGLGFHTGQRSGKNTCCVTSTDRPAAHDLVFHNSSNLQLNLFFLLQCVSQYSLPSQQCGP